MKSSPAVSEEIVQLCPQSHPLIYLTYIELARESLGYSEGFVCDECNVAFFKTAAYHCVQCKYDLCAACHAASHNTMEHRSHLIVEFCSITGAPTTIARSFLSASSWNTNIAMNQFFELNGDASKLIFLVAIAESLHTLCFCKRRLKRYDGVKESEGCVCKSCLNPIRQTLYWCSEGQRCCYRQIAGNDYRICSECYNMSNEDSPDKETETNDSDFVCKKVDISLTKRS